MNAKPPTELAGTLTPADFIEAQILSFAVLKEDFEIQFFLNATPRPLQMRMRAPHDS
jgi:hypothetical protein